MHAKSATERAVWTCSLVLLAFSATVQRGYAQSNTYTFNSIDFPTASSTSLFGINNSGQIVGTYSVDGVTTHGFLLSNGQFTTIDAPIANVTGTFLSGINNSGVIVGTYVSGKDSGFVLTGGQFSSVSFPSASCAPVFCTAGAILNTILRGVNDAGQIVGFYQSDRLTPLPPSPALGFAVHGFLLAAGNYVQLDFPGASQTLTNGINNLGQIVGNSSSGAFLFSGGTFSSLPFPGATAINNVGTIIGNKFDSSLNSHAFVVIQGTPGPAGLPWCHFYLCERRK